MTPFPSFPEELVVKILSSLAVSDLVSCRRVNRHLNGIIDSSKQLQHHIDTAVAGVVDNPNSPLSLIERKDALARRQEAWDTFQPQRTTTFKVDRMGDWHPDLDETWMYLDPLREEGCHAIVQLAFCPDNNGLIAVGMRCGDVTSFYFPPDNHSMEVDILCFSGGGGERPWTRKSTVHVKDVLKKDRVLWGMKIEIHANLLTVHLIPKCTAGGRPDSELWVFDWKTGGEIACLKGRRIKAFRFLSNSVMVVASVSPSESTATLELFSLPVTNGNVSPTSTIKVAALGLPFVDDGCRIAHVDFYPAFVKNLVKVHKNRLLYNTSIDTKPFVSTRSDNIIFIYLDIGSGYGSDNISFVVHSSTLLRHTVASSSHSHGNVRDPVPWDLWGPAVTRWCEGRILVGEGPVTCASGHRCLLRQKPASGWELWDFNPYRVRRLEKVFAVENETTHLTVETEPSCAKSLGFKEGIYSSLPFVKLVPKKWPRYTHTGLFEDRVVAATYMVGERCYLVENLYFG